MNNWTDLGRLSRVNRLMFSFIKSINLWLPIAINNLEKGIYERVLHYQWRGSQEYVEFKSTFQQFVEHWIAKDTLLPQIVILQSPSWKLKGLFSWPKWEKLSKNFHWLLLMSSVTFKEHQRKSVERYGLWRERRNCQIGKYPKSVSKLTTNLNSHPLSEQSLLLTSWRLLLAKREW